MKDKEFIQCPKYGSLMQFTHNLLKDTPGRREVRCMGLQCKTTAFVKSKTK
jgi:hypothetical protein